MGSAAAGNLVSALLAGSAGRHHRRSGVASEISDKFPAVADRPALILGPTKDLAFRESQRRSWESIISGAKTVFIDGAGHYVQEEAGEEPPDEIRKWWPG